MIWYSCLKHPNYVLLQLHLSLSRYAMNYLIFALIALPLFPMKAIAQTITHPAAIPVQVAASQAPEKAIDELTDYLFYNLYPRLNRRKIRSDERQYIKEWAAIKKVLRANLVYEKGCTSAPYWRLSEYDTPGRFGVGLIAFSPLLNLVADAVFYTRHPELQYRKIQPSETRLASEWSKIRQAVSLVDPCFY